MIRKRRDRHFKRVRPHLVVRLTSVSLLVPMRAPRPPPAASTAPPASSCRPPWPTRCSAAATASTARRARSASAGPASRTCRWPYAYPSSTRPPWRQQKPWDRPPAPYFGSATEALSCKAFVRASPNAPRSCPRHPSTPAARQAACLAACCRRQGNSEEGVGTSSSCPSGLVRHRPVRGAGPQEPCPRFHGKMKDDLTTAFEF